MAFLCPECQRPTLAILHALELGPDDFSDEVTPQVLACRCGAWVLGVYQESRRGSLDSDCWEHTGFVPEEPLEWQHWRTLMLGCPNPSDESCRCCGHEQLRVYDAVGRWCAWATLPRRSSFPLAGS